MTPNGMKYPLALWFGAVIWAGWAGGQNCNENGSGSYIETTCISGTCSATPDFPYPVCTVDHCSFGNTEICMAECTAPGSIGSDPCF